MRILKKDKRMMGVESELKLHVEKIKLDKKKPLNSPHRGTREVFRECVSKFLKIYVKQF